MIWQILAGVYFIGALIVGLPIAAFFWRRSEGKSVEQVLATRVACVVVTLLWPPFVFGAAWRALAIKKARRS